MDGQTTPGIDAEELRMLRTLERKLLWLSTWTIHHANHLRPNPGGLKVGGHQSACASATQLLTALYFHALRPEDRVAVKPHASPVFHAIQYLLGNQDLETLKRYRALGGAQSYPSKTKDHDGVDISTGSVGLGPAFTVFASLAQDYARLHGHLPKSAPQGRMIAIVGDGEMDEGSIYEALWEGWKHGLRNCWWIIDYNRQSLDGVVSDHLFRLIDRVFRATGWNVVTLKYGRRMREAFRLPGGLALKRWINDCPNALYSALTFQGGAAWRSQIMADIGATSDVALLLDRYDDDALHALMCNLGGHCLETILEAFDACAQDDRPTCFLAYTVKGYGLPIAGHRDNHSGVCTSDQVDQLRREMGIAAGEEWEPFAGLGMPAAEVQAFLDAIPFVSAPRRWTEAEPVAVPARLPVPEAERISTQEAFGKILQEIAKTDGDFASRLVSFSPDVTASTGLAGWVNRRGLFAREHKDDVFHQRHIASAHKWEASEKGQHVELGISENNLFLALAAFGLSHELFGVRLLPVGTLYDPFVARGRDALTYACYQDSRMMVVGTPSGITLSPEGGAHQSVTSPLSGIGQPGLAYFEPAFADELAVAMRWGFEHMQADDGGSVYLRLSTRPLAQPRREMTDALAADILAGAYWRIRPQDPKAGAIVSCGVLAPEAAAAHAAIGGGAGLLAITSPERLFADWRRRGPQCHLARLLLGVAPGAPLLTVQDAHPLALAWIGSIAGHPVTPLGVDRFGQCGSVDELYREYGLAVPAIVAARRAG